MGEVISSDHSSYNIVTTLELWFSNMVPDQQPRNPWDSVRNVKSGPHSRPIELDTLGVHPNTLCFNKPSG